MATTVCSSQSTFSQVHETHARFFATAAGSRGPARPLLSWLLGSFSVTKTTLQVAHGAIMTASWALCVLLGVVLARYFKHVGHPWFIAHISVNVVGLLGMAVAFILALVMVPKPYHLTSN